MLLYHFILTSYSLYIQVTPILILTEVQYLQNIAFSFEKGSKGQKHSSSDPQHPIKKSLNPIPISPSYILYITNILLYIVLLSVFIIIYKYIIYLQIFNSIDFLQYF